MSSRSFLESTYGTGLPPRLQAFYQQQEDRCLSQRLAIALEGHPDNARLRLDLSQEALLALQADFPPAHFAANSAPSQQLIPLGWLDGQLPLACDIRDDACPLYGYNPSVDAYDRLADSLDTFIRDHTSPGDSRPVGPELKLACQAARTCLDGDSHDRAAEALALLEPFIASPQLAEYAQLYRDWIPYLWNLYGVALDRLDRREDANQAFARAHALGDAQSGLNLAQNLLQAGDWTGAETLLGPLCEAWRPLAQRSQAQALSLWLTLARDGLDSALAQLARLSAQCAIEQPQLLTGIAQQLADWIQAGLLPSSAQTLTAACEPKAPVLDADAIATNRAWWQQLAKQERKLAAALKALLASDKTPSDTELARLLQFSRISLDATSPVKDLAVFSAFKSLSYLRLHCKTPETGRALQALPQLKTLIINDQLIKDFCFPDPNAPALFKAIKAGDQSRVAALLAQGSRLDLRDESGDSLFAQALRQRQPALARWLVQQGAPIHSKNFRGKSARRYAQAADWPQYEQLFEQVGGQRPQPAFYELTAATDQGSSCSELEGFDALTLNAGHSVAQAFADADPWVSISGKALADFYAGPGYCIWSQAGKDLLQAQRLAGVEFLPIRVQGTLAKGQPFYLLHSIRLQDALDEAASGIKRSAIDPEAIKALGNLVLDPARLDPDLPLFRLRDYPDPLLVTAALKQQLEASALRGLRFIDPNAD